MLAQNSLTCAHGCQGARGGNAECMHGLRDHIFAQNRPIPRAPIAIARPGRTSGAFELNIKAPQRSEHFSKQNRAPISKLGVPMAKLMPCIGLCYWIRAQRNLIARQKDWPILTKDDAQFLRMV